MVDVLLVADGEVGGRVLASLKQLNGVTVTTVAATELLKAATDIGGTPADYIVLHDVPLRTEIEREAKPTEKEALLHKVIRELGALRPRVPVAVLLEFVEDDDLKKAVFVSSVDVGFDLGEDLVGLDEAIELLEKRLGAVASRSNPPAPNAHEIGSLVDVDFADNSQGHGPTNRPGTAYRMARWRSLMPVDGSKFAQDVRDVVDALARFPLRVNLPWDPLDRPARDHDPGKPPNPQRLKDVLRAFGDADEVRQRLFGKAKPPVSRDDATYFLAGNRHPTENEGAYKRWWGRWGEGANPPPLLLDGETGVGKSLMAEFITFLLTPTRSDGANQELTSRSRFVKANGAGLKVDDFNHQLMGAAPGMYTDGADAVVGKLTRAAHGVFFLDEVGDMAGEVQAALLTFLDDRLIQPAGIEPFKGYQHIIGATNKKLEDEVASGAFRQDLLARFPLRLTIPPLRTRSEAERKRWIDFLAQDPVVNPRVGESGAHEVTHIERGALDKLIDHDYTNGNFRELTERVHASIRSARRNLRQVVLAVDVPGPAMANVPIGNRGELPS